MKVLYGMEAYFVDDTARAVFGNQNADFAKDEFVVFDVETTGLSTLTCNLTEIGAVRVKGGQVLERFNTFVDPEQPIPEEIVALTGIRDDMVKGAPKSEEAVRDFLRFCGRQDPDRPTTRPLTFPSCARSATAVIFPLKTPISTRWRFPAMSTRI